MISGLEIEGFKSFGTPASHIPFGALNVLVGANGTGKSNLLAALKFVRLAVRHDVEFAVNQLGGPGEVRNKILREQKAPKPVRLKVSFSEPWGREAEELEGFRVSRASYEIVLDLRDESGVPRIQRETLKAIVNEGEKEKEFLLQRDGDTFSVKDPTAPERFTGEKWDIPKQEGTKLAIGAWFPGWITYIVRNQIETMRSYNISPHISRETYRDLPEAELGESGEHLSVVLHQLERKLGKGGLEKIASGLRGVIPGFKTIRPVKLSFEDKWAFQVVEERIKGFIPPSAASDGTIRLLALMVISTATADNASLIAIEEPENGLHPHLSEHIVELLREASKKCQILVTTHSPSLLDHFEPQEVLLADRPNGFTKIVRADSLDRIALFKKHFQLGELWVQGVLGGIPS